MEEKTNFFQKTALFWRENSGTVVKIFIHQIGLTVFGFLLNSAASASKSTAVTVALGVFSALFYLALLYIMSWDNGAKDKIRIDSGRIKLDRFKGARTAILASVPNLILALLALIGFLCINKSVLSPEGAYVTPKWAMLLYSVAQLLGIFLNSMYTGIAEPINLASKPFYLFIVCIPAIIVCGLGYFLGTKEKFGVFTSAPKK
jgi:hypothetical protein